jgi:hypothetical protein
MWESVHLVSFAFWLHLPQRQRHLPWSLSLLHIQPALFPGESDVRSSLRVLKCSCASHLTYTGNPQPCVFTLYSGVRRPGYGQGFWVGGCVPPLFHLSDVQRPLCSQTGFCASTQWQQFCQSMNLEVSDFADSMCPSLHDGQGSTQNG